MSKYTVALRMYPESTDEYDEYPPRERWVVLGPDDHISDAPFNDEEDAQEVADDYNRANETFVCNLCKKETSIKQRMGPIRTPISEQYWCVDCFLKTHEDPEDDDPQCACGTYRSEHALCGCPEGFQTQASWAVERSFIASLDDDDFDRIYHPYG